jgi:hypothetical protein
MARSELALPEGISDDQNSDIDVDSALDDLLSNSDMLQEAGISTRDDDEEADADNAEEEDDLLEDESGDEEDKAEGNDGTDEEPEDDDDSDKDSTEDEGEDDSDDGEIDWDFKVPVKVDGEDSELELAELVKGYQTSQHLSKKGRDLADERKAFEAERTTETDRLVETAKILQAQNTYQETELSKEYAELDKELKAAKKDGDKYRQDEIAEKVEEVKASYWKARQTREKIEEGLRSHEESSYQKYLEDGMARFNEEISDYVPDFNEEKAVKLREFAVSKGISEEILATLIDAKIIGALNEFMEISEKASKGSAKRKVAPKRSPSQTKKTKPASVKRSEKRRATSKRIQSGDADESDVDDALDSLVGKYFG